MLERKVKGLGKPILYLDFDDVLHRSAATGIHPKGRRRTRKAKERKEKLR